MLQFLQHVTIGVNWCWRRSSQGRNCWWTLQLDPGNLTPSLVLGASILPAFPTPEGVPRTLPWDSKLSLRPPGLNMWLNRIKASVRTFKILAGQCGDLLIAWLPKTSLKCILIPSPPNLGAAVCASRGYHGDWREYTQSAYSQKASPILWHFV